ncbi:MAG: thiosulfate oxidation carrier protein SoxY [Gammaproteobacteria bacterium]
MTDGHRRSFIKNSLCLLGMVMAGMAGLLKPLVACAERNSKAFTAETEADAVSALFPDQNVLDGKAVQIDVHDVVENGAVVPLSITADLPDVQSITILVEKNPNPLIAKFNLGPGCSGFIATRIKVAEPSDIIAVVEAQGKLYSTRKFVEVITGGCG